MKLLYRDTSDSADLFRVYNEQLAGVPHCYPVSAEEFEDGVRFRENPSNPHAEIHSEKIIVCLQGDKILGFAHASIGEIEVFGRTKRGGLIHFLTYQPGCRSAGQALLEECERYLSESGVDRFWAFQNASNYRFYHLGFGYLSDRMGHVYALFRMNQYEIDIGEVFLERPEYNVVEPSPPDSWAEICVQQKPGRGALPGLVIWAFRGGDQFGECVSVSVGEFCRANSAQDWFFTKWLGVEEEEQGKGWGRYLLQRMLWEMRKLGYKNAVISTNVRNYRAQLFYTNYGYKVVDTAYGLVKNSHQTAES